MRSLFILLVSIIVFAAAYKLPKFSSITRSNTLLKNMIECQVDEFDLNVIQQSATKPVIVDFYAEWCGPCKLVGPIFQSLADELTEVKFVKVDTDKHEDKVDSFNIQGLPLFGIFRNGRMVASHSGALSKDNLRKFINENMNNETPIV